MARAFSGRHLGVICAFWVAGCGGEAQGGAAANGNLAGAAGNTGAVGGASTQAGGVASTQAGGKASGGASSTTGVQAGGAPEGGIGGQTQPNIGGTGGTGVLTTAAPEVLGVWHYDWMGSNLSYIQIALCGDGMARYLHATGPKDAAPTIFEGTYLSLPLQPNRVTATFVRDVIVTTEPLVIELEYKPAEDSLVRLDGSNGYNPSGARFDPTTRPAAAAKLSCE